ncbi:hypothetical protein [Candidatus Nitrosotalea bavarica]|uniref:hypothetical protein n=1 Tax=Candidatus Nitrosotalea bavarica TaxID=1903277 RepID=UPI000C714108|nr:hypothetical protein [Candidatus Nitrosotalea bavarica]
MKRSLFTLVLVGGFSAIIIFLVTSFLPLTITSEKYSILVDPIMIQDEMGTETHVTIKNTGTDTLTNIVVNYGEAVKPDVIPKLDSGEKISLSPPVGSDLKVVKVTTDEGIDITKVYRTPTSVSFVGNSGYGG